MLIFVNTINGDSTKQYNLIYCMKCDNIVIKCQNLNHRLALLGQKIACNKWIDNIS